MQGVQSNPILGSESAELLLILTPCSIEKIRIGTLAHRSGESISNSLQKFDSITAAIFKMVYWLLIGLKKNTIYAILTVAVSE